MKLMVLLACIAIAFGAPAFAQDASVPNTSINLGDIIGPWLEMIVGAVAILVTAILGWLAALIKAKTGIDIEARHREALQTALTNAAGLMLRRLGDKANLVSFDVHNPIIREGILYVTRSAPDAVKKFGLSPEQLAEKLVAKLGLATATAALPEPASV